VLDPNTKPNVDEFCKKDKPKKAANKLGKSEFQASNASFRKRYQIVFNELCGEAGDVCDETITHCFAILPVPVYNRTCLQRENIWDPYISITGRFH